jgi:hypothetical protein
MSSWINFPHKKRNINDNVHNNIQINKNFQKAINTEENIIKKINIDTSLSLNISTAFTYIHFPQFAENSEYCAILLESRSSENILKNIYVHVLQLSRFLNNKWSIILFVTKEVFNTYFELFNKLQLNIKIKTLEYKLTSIADYNNILLNISFWEKLKIYNKVLIFQYDSQIFKYGIEQFLHYDYVGAPWPENLNTATLVGNGGFSLRSINATIDCLSNINSIIIPNYTQNSINIEKLGKYPEDIFYSHAMKQLQYKVPRVNIASQFSIETCNFNINSIGSHQLDIFNKNLYELLFLKSLIPYYANIHNKKEHHRFGWNYVDNELQKVFYNNKGIELDTWCDCNYIFENINKKDISWVGIFHLTPVNFNNYFKMCDINRIKQNKNFISNLTNCKGIFVMSEYMKNILSDILTEICINNSIHNIPFIDVLYHPVSFEGPLFNISNINNIQNVVLIGMQLRRISTIFKLKTIYNKIWLPGNFDEKSKVFSLLEQECKDNNISISEEEKNSVCILKLDNNDYDNIITNNIIILDVYDASANNTVIECISKNIPLFVRKHPAIEEYIGTDYPLFFTSLEELEHIHLNNSLIKRGYNYLINNTKTKEKLSINNFIKNIYNSKITKQICGYKDIYYDL